MHPLYAASFLVMIAGIATFIAACLTNIILFACGVAFDIWWFRGFALFGFALTIGGFALHLFCQVTGREDRI